MIKKRKRRRRNCENDGEKAYDGAPGDGASSRRKRGRGRSRLHLPNIVLIWWNLARGKYLLRIGKILLRIFVFCLKKPYLFSRFKFCLFKEKNVVIWFAGCFFFFFFVFFFFTRIHYLVNWVREVWFIKKGGLKKRS